jgi:ferredoxin-NADP reductase
MNTLSNKNFSVKNQKPKSKLMRLLNQSLVNNASLSSYYEPLIQSFIPAWSTRKFRAKVTNICRISSEVITLSLKPSGQWPCFQAGQYIELTVNQNGAFVTRCFSISSSTTHWTKTGEIELTVREQDQGRITPWLINGLKRNQYVQISKPKGDFIFHNTQRDKLLIAGGTGITPIKSLLSSVNRHPGKLDLIYFSRDTHLFKEQLETLSKSLETLTIHLIDTKQQGHLTSELLKGLCPDAKQRQIYLCGPTQLSDSATQILNALGIPEEEIIQEHFLPIRKSPTHQTALNDTATQAQLTFNKAGRKIEANYRPDQTLLEAAEEAKLSPNYGCRMGICHQCKCTKTRGVVLNTLTGEVSDTSEEVIQLCISMPLSDLEVQL